MSDISILLAVYNGANYLDSALQSICDQDFKDWELIAVENGSTDNSFEILQKWSQIDSRIRIYSIEEKGKNKAFNMAFAKSKSKLVCFFAADDLLHNQSLGIRQEPLLFPNSKFNYSTCLLETISDDVNFNGLVFPKNRNKPNFSGGSIFFTRDLASKIFPIPIELPNEDLWTALHLKYFGSGFHIPKPLYYYRIHHNNSYGYHVSFDLKRKAFLERMKAFNLFLIKQRFNLSKKNIIYFENFEKARLLAEKRDMVAIALAKLPVKDKILFIYYCSPFMFWFKQKLFKLLSGKFELI